MSDNQIISLLVYGSLINKYELLNNEIEILAYQAILLKGFKREFSQEPSWRKSIDENRAVLTSYKDKDYSINALLINIYKKDIKVLDTREIGYNRVAIDSSEIVFKYKTSENILTNEIFIYIGKEDKYSSSILPNRNYLDICLIGARQWGNEFYEDFISSTFVKDEALKSFIKSF